MSWIGNLLRRIERVLRIHRWSADGVAWALIKQVRARKEKVSPFTIMRARDIALEIGNPYKISEDVWGKCVKLLLDVQDMLDRGVDKEGIYVRFIAELFGITNWVGRIDEEPVVVIPRVLPNDARCLYDKEPIRDEYYWSPGGQLFHSKRCFDDWCDHG